MSDCKKKPKLSKTERLAQALRTNLLKRKQQQRTRDTLKVEEKIVPQDPQNTTAPQPDLEEKNV